MLSLADAYWLAPHAVQVSSEAPVTICPSGHASHRLLVVPPHGVFLWRCRVSQVAQVAQLACHSESRYVPGGQASHTVLLAAVQDVLTCVPMAHVSQLAHRVLVVGVHGSWYCAAVQEMVVHLSHRQVSVRRYQPGGHSRHLVV